MIRQSLTGCSASRTKYLQIRTPRKQLPKNRILKNCCRRTSWSRERELLIVLFLVWDRSGWGEVAGPERHPDRVMRDYSGSAFGGQDQKIALGEIVT